jgi:hypothetical protein
MSSKDQLKDYVSSLKHEMTKQKQETEMWKRLYNKQELENARLRKVCGDNCKEIFSLEETIEKTKRWYQILIWKK